MVLHVYMQFVVHVHEVKHTLRCFVSPLLVLCFHLIFNYEIFILSSCQYNCMLNKNSNFHEAKYLHCNQKTTLKFNICMHHLCSKSNIAVVPILGLGQIMFKQHVNVRSLIKTFEHCSRHLNVISSCVNRYGLYHTQSPTDTPANQS